MRWSWKLKRRTPIPPKPLKYYIKTEQRLTPEMYERLSTMMGLCLRSGKIPVAEPGFEIVKL